MHSIAQFKAETRYDFWKPPCVVGSHLIRSTAQTMESKEVDSKVDGFLYFAYTAGLTEYQLYLNTYHELITAVCLNYK